MDNLHGLENPGQYADYLMYYGTHNYGMEFEEIPPEDIGYMGQVYRDEDDSESD